MQANFWMLWQITDTFANIVPVFLIQALYEKYSGADDNMFWR